MKKTTQLRNIIYSNQLEFIMEAHHALSAKIVEEAGFKGIWASGLSISAALGVRDNNEASWTQILEVLEFMSDATFIPILLDGDTGYGNFNNARRLVKKLEQRQIAGVCIEDKVFPKTNSFINGEAQPLADIDEFCGKIKAMKDSQTDDDFVLVSRVEAFIAGWGLEEALKRAEAYRIAGTDAILIHSKRSDVKEIEAFMKEWGNRLPVVIVPTKYYSVPTNHLRDLGISLSIWANHNLRASIKAMQFTSRQIHKDESLLHVEKTVVPLEEVFRLQAAQELAAAEEIYLGTSKPTMNSIILIKQSGKTSLFFEQMNQLKAFGIKEIDHVELGNSSSSIEGELAYFRNIINKIGENTLISYSDIMYKPHLLQELAAETNEITIVVDPDMERQSEEKHYVIANRSYSKMLYSKNVDLVRLTNDPNELGLNGEFIGLWKISGKGVNLISDVLNQLAMRKDFGKLTLVDLFNQILITHKIAVKYIRDSWLDMDTYKKIQESG
ncbi:phosphoenolpyruvate mutase [Bacillus sp. CGMCC 1.16607]|uniref:phosphoenolpyruvate mutase n=1 Tax=Bacillus sp. CGMCC 1.16607 TaxID=3351842 RepID=UPI00362F2A5E